MEDLSLHILDIAENSLDAGAQHITISLLLKRRTDRLILQIRDDGRGMSAELCALARDPFFTTRTVRRVGLGVPLLAQSAEDCNGSLSIDSQQGLGTTVTAEFQLSHIDRKPLGDIGATMTVLIAAHPEKEFRLLFEDDALSYRFDTLELRESLDGLPLSHPDVLQLMKAEINEAVRLEA